MESLKPDITGTHEEEATKPGGPNDGQDAERILRPHGRAQHGRDKTEVGTAANAIEDEEDREDTYCRCQRPDD